MRETRLNPHLQQFIDQLRGQSPTNRRNYGQRVSALLAFVGRPVGEVRQQDVNAFLRSFQDDGYSPVTVAGYRQAVRAFFAWCEAAELVASSPANHLRVGRVVPDVVHIPEEEDVVAVTAVARRWSHEDDYCRRRAAVSWMKVRCVPSGAVRVNCCMWIVPTAPHGS